MATPRTVTLLHMPRQSRSRRPVKPSRAGISSAPEWLIWARLARYLGVVGLAGRGEHGARLVAGQFHDVVLAGEVAYRFPRDEESRRRLPSMVTLPAALSRPGAQRWSLRCRVLLEARPGARLPAATGSLTAAGVPFPTRHQPCALEPMPGPGRARRSRALPGCGSDGKRRVTRARHLRSRVRK